MGVGRRRRVTAHLLAAVVTVIGRAGKRAYRWGLSLAMVLVAVWGVLMVLHLHCPFWNDALLRPSPVVATIDLGPGLVDANLYALAWECDGNSLLLASTQGIYRLESSSGRQTELCALPGQVVSLRALAGGGFVCAVLAPQSGPGTDRIRFSVRDRDGRELYAHNLPAGVSRCSLGWAPDAPVCCMHARGMDGLLLWRFTPSGCIRQTLPLPAVALPVGAPRVSSGARFVITYSQLGSVLARAIPGPISTAPSSSVQFSDWYSLSDYRWEGFDSDSFGVVQSARKGPWLLHVSPVDPPISGARLLVTRLLPDGPALHARRLGPLWERLPLLETAWHLLADSPDGEKQLLLRSPRWSAQEPHELWYYMPGGPLRFVCRSSHGCPVPLASGAWALASWSPDGGRLAIAVSREQILIYRPQ